MKQRITVIPVAWGGIFILSLILVLLPYTGYSGELDFHPSIGVSEEFTDNVYENRNNRESEFITRLMPGLALKYNAPLWDWDVAYNLDYRLYARNTRGDELTHKLAAKGQIRIIDELFFLDLSDTFSRVSIDVTRDYTQEGLYANQTDSNTVSASPYFVLHPGPQTTVKTGYRYTNVWYKEPGAIDKQEHNGFLDVTYEYSPKLSLTAGYTYTRQESISPFDRHSPYAGVRYEYFDKCFVFAQGGYTWISYRNSARGDFNSLFWNVGVTHTMGTYVITASAAVSYPEDPLSGVTREKNYTLGVSKSIDRGELGGSLYYSTYDGSNVDRTKKYGVGLTARYEFTEKLSGRLAANVERYEYRTASGHTRRIFVAPGLSYTLPWDTTLTLSYYFINYHSASIYDDNYSVNRVVLAASKTF